MKHTLTLSAAFSALMLLSACAAGTDAMAATDDVAAAASQTQQMDGEMPIQFETDDGETVEAFEGTFTVPENRANPDSRILTLHYVRFPATTDTPGAPIIYLSGGPGGSGINTAKGARFPLFMAMRQHGDVIAYDQRGTGRSNDMESCTRPGPSLTTTLSDADYRAGEIAALTACMEEWEESGIDLDGYDTVENARDLDALRLHLGADSLSLWGISYGSHLGMTALREMDGHIDRAIFASIEGLDQTVKLPARSDAYFERLQTAMSARDPNMPDIKALIRRVHARFDETPQLMTIDGTDAIFHRRDLQTLLSGAVSDPKWAMLVVNIYRDLDQGDMSSFEQLYARWGVTSDYQFRPMNQLTDLASGTDMKRRQLIEDQGRSALIGTRLNAPYAFEDIRPALVLGPDFREAVRTDVPVLMLSGTLDGRTFPAAAREASARMPNVTHVMIRDAGHNLFMTDPAVGELMHRFMRGDSDLPSEITVPIPE